MKSITLNNSEHITKGSLYITITNRHTLALIPCFVDLFREIGKEFPSKVTGLLMEVKEGKKILLVKFIVNQKQNTGTKKKYATLKCKLQKL